MVLYSPLVRIGRGYEIQPRPVEAAASHTDSVSSPIPNILGEGREKRGWCNRRTRRMCEYQASAANAPGVYYISARLSDNWPIRGHSNQPESALQTQALTPMACNTFDGQADVLSEGTPVPRARRNNLFDHDLVLLIAIAVGVWMLMSGCPAPMARPQSIRPSPYQQQAQSLARR